MRKYYQPWFCEKCGCSGNLLLSVGEDALTVAHRIQRVHVASAPKCTNPTSKIRVSNPEAA